MAAESGVILALLGFTPYMRPGVGPGADQAEMERIQGHMRIECRLHCREKAGTFLPCHPFAGRG